MQLSRKARESATRDLYLQPYPHREILTIDDFSSMGFEISYKDLIRTLKFLICEITDDGVVMHNL